MSYVGWHDAGDMATQFGLSRGQAYSGVIGPGRHGRLGEGAHRPTLSPTCMALGQRILRERFGLALLRSVGARPTLTAPESAAYLSGRWPARNAISRLVGTQRAVWTLSLGTGRFGCGPRSRRLSRIRGVLSTGFSIRCVGNVARDGSANRLRCFVEWCLAGQKPAARRLFCCRPRWWPSSLDEKQAMLSQRLFQGDCRCGSRSPEAAFIGRVGASTCQATRLSGSLYQRKRTSTSYWGWRLVRANCWAGRSTGQGQRSSDCSITRRVTSMPLPNAFLASI